METMEIIQGFMKREQQEKQAGESRQEQNSRQEQKIRNR